MFIDFPWKNATEPGKNDEHRGDYMRPPLFFICFNISLAFFPWHSLPCVTHFAPKKFPRPWCWSQKKINGFNIQLHEQDQSLALKKFYGWGHLIHATFEENKM